MKRDPLKVGDNIVVYGTIPATITEINPARHNAYHVQTATGKNWVALSVISRALDSPAVAKKLARGPLPKETLF
jgi:hypothetical protein